MKSQQLQLRKAHRRSRIPLSCDSCRSRKLRCNREKPCQNCSTRGEQTSCKFREPTNNTVDALVGPTTCKKGPVDSGSRAPVNGDRTSVGAGGIERAASETTPPVVRDTSLSARNSAGRTKAQSNNDIGQRIKHLEDLVNKLVTERPSSSAWTPPHSIRNNLGGVYTPEKSDKTEGEGSGSSDATPDDTFTMKAVGKTVMDGLHSVYLDGDDWSVVLQEINELKRTWRQEQDEPRLGDYYIRPTLSHTVDGSNLLFDQATPLDMADLISTMPPKSEVDRLLAYFFDRGAFPISVPPILHEPTFMREYNEYWVKPSEAASLMWLGLVFSILGITMLAYHQYGEPPEYEGRAEILFQLYRMRTAQCLLRGDMAKCAPYTVETLRFNATAELNRKDDNRRGLWIMTGLVMRAAINMGYHREPAAASSGISVLQAEYRRRTWCSVVSMDNMASFLAGLPRTMSGVYSDTLEPRNLHDWELSEGMAALPPSRPFTEATDATYLIIKARLLLELGRVADLNSNPTFSSYDTVVDIDRALHDVYDSFPPYLKVQQLPVSAVDFGIPQIGDLANFSNLSLVCMYHRGVCRLHRRFLAVGRSEGQFQLSRDRCISSALELLAFQNRLVPAFYRISQTRQMVMLGSMVLFLELALRRKAAPDEDDMVPASSFLLQALETSSGLLSDAIYCCEETRKMHQLLVGMLSSFGAGPAQMAAQEPLDQPLSLISTPPFDFFAGGFPLDKDWSEMDMDWNTWDTFLEDSSYQPGPIY